MLLKFCLQFWFNIMVVVDSHKQFPRRKAANKTKLLSIFFSFKWTQIQACTHTGDHTFLLMHLIISKVKCAGPEF